MRAVVVGIAALLPTMATTFDELYEALSKTNLRPSEAYSIADAMARGGKMPMTLRASRVCIYLSSLTESQLRSYLADNIFTPRLFQKYNYWP